MQIQFSLNAEQLKLACQRLGTKLDGTGDDLIQFNIAASGVEVTATGGSEGLDADVFNEGTASVPGAVLNGVMQALPYFGRQKIDIGFSDGRMRVDGIVFYHGMIALSRTRAADQRELRSRRGALTSQIA